MEDCIFCKIVANEVPNERVYEDDSYIAFLDIVKPLSPGHILVVPKKHYRFVWDVPETEFGAYMAAVHKLARALQGTFDTDMVLSKVIGEEVPHAHVWLFPSPDKAEGDKNDFKGNAKKIKNALN